MYHDRYKRTRDGWKFIERVYEVKYLDTTPLAGSAPHAAGAPGNPLEDRFEKGASGARGNVPVVDDLV